MYNVDDKLKSLGLSDKETLVYKAIVELGGGSYPSTIASKANLNRSTTYKILLSLSVKGLINEVTKKNKVYYQIEKAEKILTYAKKQLEKAQDNVEYLEKALPEIKALLSHGDMPKVSFYEGTEGVQEVYDDMLDYIKPYEMLAIGNTQGFEKLMTEKKIQHFVKTKAKIGITTRGIAPDTNEDKEYSNKFFFGLNKKYYPNLRFIPVDMFPFQSEITIYGFNKVAITKLTNNKAIGVIIEDSSLHGFMKMIFELAWMGSERFNK